MTKSPRKNVPNVGIELGAACMPSGHASDRAIAPGAIEFGSTDYVYQMALEENLTININTNRDIYIHRDNSFLNETIWFKLWHWSRETEILTPTGFQSDI